jgi:hypothetical protein
MLTAFLVGVAFSAIAILVVVRLGRGPLVETLATKFLHCRVEFGVTIGYPSQEPQLDPGKDVRGNVEEAVASTSVTRCGRPATFMSAENLPRVTRRE